VNAKGDEIKKNQVGKKPTGRGRVEKPKKKMSREPCWGGGGANWRKGGGHEKKKQGEHMTKKSIFREIYGWIKNEKKETRQK